MGQETESNGNNVGENENAWCRQDCETLKKEIVSRGISSDVLSFCVGLRISMFYAQMYCQKGFLVVYY